MSTAERQKLYYACIAGIAVAACLSPTSLPAQQDGALEQIIVTAQRREQSLLEVPVSLEVHSGAELRQQGFRTMDQLAEFSPSVEIDIRRQDQDISIRGIGTTGNNLTLEQAAPTFVDGIHYGRTSMIKSAFLDLERIEVLRGPQPVYFGQNATAGAFSLVTRKPGPTWEGDLTLEAGNYGRQTIEGAVGGPLTDSLGIRVAGKWDTLDGFLTDVITGDEFPNRRDVAGRITLQWAPTERFESTFQIGVAESKLGAEPVALCLGKGNDTRPEHRPILGREALVHGRTSFDDIYRTIPLAECGDGNTPFNGLGIKTPTAFFDPPPDVNQEDSDGTGFLDIRDVVRDIRKEKYGDDLATDGNLDTYNSYLELNYHLDNGILLTSLTGFIDYYRSYNRDNSISPFLGNMRQRTEDFVQYSQEFRITSPLGETIEWMAGAYWQEYDLDLTVDNFRANMRRPRRYNEAWEDARWLSAFGTVTFNFLDDKLSLDLGGRLTDIEKEGYIIGYGALWIFADPPEFAEPPEDGVPPTLVVPGGYTFPWRTQVIADNWHAPIGMTEIDPTIRRTPGPYQEPFSATEFDPQVTLRYRPTDNISTYAKWAQAFKSGGFETGVGSLPDTEEDFLIGSEFAENWEIGAKGTFWDGRARGALSLFWMEVEDLQLATTIVDVEGEGALGSESTNAGLQRVRGADFSVNAALTERLTVGFAGALMDGEMVEYEGAGCTDVEFANAHSGPCISEAESIALTGDDELAGLIDRSGSPAPRTPDWKFALNVDYTMPLLERFEGSFNGYLSWSDGYITNVEDFSLIQKAGAHADLNLTIGFGDRDGAWRASFWGRNLLEAQEEYNPEFDLEADGIVSDNLSLSHFRTYGVQFQYNYY